MFKKLCFSLILFSALNSYGQPTDLYMVGDAANEGSFIPFAKDDTKVVFVLGVE